MLKILVLLQYMILGFIVILGPVKLANYLYYEKEIKINRWLLAFISPFVLIIPKIIFPKVPRIILTILIIIFIFLTVLFFETTRLFIENKEIRGVVDYSNYREDKENN